MVREPGSSRCVLLFSQPLVLHHQQALSKESGAVIDLTKHQHQQKSKKEDEEARHDYLTPEARAVLWGLTRTLIESCFNSPSQIIFPLIGQPPCSRQQLWSNSSRYHRGQLALWCIIFSMRRNGIGSRPLRQSKGGSRRMAYGDVTFSPRAVHGTTSGSASPLVVIPGRTSN